MASTNFTPNYNLPIFVPSDIPSWLGDFNGAMTKIDTAIKAASETGGVDPVLKTINGESLYGTGDITTLTNVKSLGGVSLAGEGNIPIASINGQSLLSNNDVQVLENVKTINNQTMAGTGNLEISEAKILSQSIASSINITTGSGTVDAKSIVQSYTLGGNIFIGGYVYINNPASATSVVNISIPSPSSSLSPNHKAIVHSYQYTNDQNPPKMSTGEMTFNSTSNTLALSFPKNIENNNELVIEIPFQYFRRAI